MDNFIKQLTGAHVIRKYSLKIIERLHWAWSINVILFVPPQCDENHSPSSPYESSNARVLATLLVGHQECAQSRNMDMVSSQRMHYSCMNAKHESRSKFAVFFTANYTNTKVKKNRLAKTSRYKCTHKHADEPDRRIDMYHSKEYWTLQYKMYRISVCFWQNCSENPAKRFFVSKK